MPVLQVEKGSQGARATATAITLRQKNTHCPTNPQPSHEQPGPPTKSTHHTEARDSVENPREGEGGGQTKTGEGGEKTLHYLNRMPSKQGY